MAEPIAPPPPDLATASLDEIARAVADKRLPPVAMWNPSHCGDIDIRIATDGTWFHEGTPIGRQAMVRLFSTILRREPDGSHVLVTPVEKMTIRVDDAPFVAVELQSEGTGKDRRLAFRLNTDDMIIAGPENPLRVEVADDGQPRPYVHVRGQIGCGLEALINRPVFYELAELALGEQAEGHPPGLWSGGSFFAFAH